MAHSHGNLRSRDLSHQMARYRNLHGKNLSHQMAGCWRNYTGRTHQAHDQHFLIHGRRTHQDRLRHMGVPSVRTRANLPNRRGRTCQICPFPSCRQQVMMIGLPMFSRHCHRARIVVARIVVAVLGGKRSLRKLGASVSQLIGSVAVLCRWPRSLRYMMLFQMSFQTSKKLQDGEKSERRPSQRCFFHK